MRRTIATLALIPILLGSIALPCYAAASAMARESAGPMAPCSAEDEPSPAFCAAAGMNAPLGVVAEDIPAPDVVQAHPVEGPDARPGEVVVSSRAARNHSPPPAGAPLFLLHATLLI